ncbi:MAG: hypothetical protein FWD60_03590 [Candidatus Azobacteroides sp.]|nr:hypothetical protein [Candidatus Azobacteroides sp.]
MKKLFTLFFMCFTALYSWANTGWFQDYIVINANAGANEYYWIGDNPNYGTKLDGHDFGEVGSLLIDGCDLKYWDDGGGTKRTGGAFYYEIRSSNGATVIVPAVEEIWAQTSLGGNDFQGKLSGLNIDLATLSQLENNTTYQLRIWAKSWGSGDSWLSNSGNNYVATFTVKRPSFDVTLTAPAQVYANETISLSAVSVNVNNPVYVYSVKEPGSEIFVTTTSPYQPTMPGTYTFKVTVAESDATSVILAEDEKEVLVIAVVDPVTFTFNLTAPKGTGDVWITGSFNSWSEPFAKMTNVSDNLYTYTISAPAILDPIEYKYYWKESGWDNVENQADGTPCNAQGDHHEAVFVDGGSKNDIVPSWNGNWLGQVDFTVTFTGGVSIPAKLYIAVDYGSGVVYEQMTKTKVEGGDGFTISLQQIPYRMVYGYLRDNSDPTGSAATTDGIVTQAFQFDVITAFATPTKNKDVFDSVIVRGMTSTIHAEFSGVALIELYATNGVLLNKTIAVDSFAQTGLASGLYIVKINGKASKVLVK